MENVVATLESIAAGFATQLPLIVLALIVVVLAMVVGRLADRAVQAALRAHDAVLARMVGLLTRILVVAVGMLLALWVALPTVRFTDVFAGLGVTGLILGFALRDIIENFVAGLLILWRRPFVVGDQILTGQYEGWVEEVNFRSTVLRTYDGVRVLIPNAKVFTEPVENRTANRTIRSRVVLGIDQRAGIADARRVILETLRATDGVLHDPDPVVLFDEIADYTNNLVVLFWVEPPTRLSELQTRSIVTERLNEALQAAGVGFPYPVRDLRVQAPDALRVQLQRGAG